MAISYIIYSIIIIIYYLGGLFTSTTNKSFLAKFIVI